MWSLLGGWGGGRGLHAVMTGRVVEWFWMAKCNHNCWNSIAVSFVKASCEDKTCPLGYSSSAAYSGAECLPFLCAVWAWSCCQLRTNSDKQMEIEQLLFKYCSCSRFPALCPSACALSLLWWLPSMKCPTKHMPWCFALDHVNYETSNFQLIQLFWHGAFLQNLVWKTKQRKRRGNLCGLPTPSSGIFLWMDSLY